MPENYVWIYDRLAFSLNLFSVDYASPSTSIERHAKWALDLSKLLFNAG
jgi:hypothetical protein